MIKFKHFKIVTIITLLITVSCNKGVLDKVPLDIISDAVVWNDQALVEAYLTGAYVSTTVFTNDAVVVESSAQPFFAMFYVNNVSDESKSTSNFSGNAYVFKTGGLKIQGGLMEWWEKSYKVIRSLNELIERLPQSTLSEEFKNKRIAEARYLRAFNYFYMVKRYGGVPLIKKAQSINDSQEELYASRNSEKEVYDFILSELKEISSILPKIQAANDWGRPTKFAALALTSRAALYAGSIAKYGTLQLNGLLGFNASEANSYYQQSADASRQIMESNQFKLYDADADKITNFKNIFLVKKNAEVIFAKQHDGSNKDIGGAGWAYDYFQCPYPNGWANGIHDAPYLEVVESFENKDGSSGKLDQAVLNSKLWTMQELWGNKDPRFQATIYTQDTKWQGRNLNFYNGIRTADGTILTVGSYQGVLANGDQKSTQTGFGVMKYLDESKENGDGSTAGIFGSTQDYIVFRYAEILLNDAEAAYELGLTPEALDAINKIRTRAGIALLTSIDMEHIRNERKVELAFEGHRYWDLRRWRLAEDYLSRNGHGVRYILDHATGKFLVKLKDKQDGTVTSPLFGKQNYYFPITLTRTANNANLVENPGY
ncbi:RagB/SusD family nutrient uptake outer membrane protein [Arcticibacter eurypsychrophilus]|uniref:RagB/SusD family nutrient uptake outer membrane protein n=1 Tax=Arcticibacter eurypsychrophilus TaxID=1434752 RepID=UPI00084D361A|nr:RagB/SusD family nutrient uptake outer membrane protein [Arcticibacter eurypsychrophilus]